jgi:malto-oligosyltrehalose trehalohydrolase
MMARNPRLRPPFVDARCDPTSLARPDGAFEFGPQLRSDGCRFRLWAPARQSVGLRVDGGDYPMTAIGGGWFEQIVPAPAGSRYAFAVGDLVVPDPASRFQPDGVHAPSEVIDAGAYRWNDGGWRGLPWEEVVLYELHVGAFTAAGTYRAAIERLDDLCALGVTAVELMPVAQAAGRRNWGYDGVDLFAPAAGYGRPDDLRALVDAAHTRGVAVFLDVVYNHFGPDGNYLGVYAPQFFTKRHQTPWGAAIDLSGPHAKTVREFFIENALYWCEDFHVDGLRLDAVHALQDDSSYHFLDDLATRVKAAAAPDRHVHLVVENDDNSVALLDRSRDAYFDAQWNDDAHHALHVALTGERSRYYRDYPHPVWAIGRALSEGFTYQGEPSEHRGGQARGEPSAHLPPTAFLDFLQNHDQVGNRAFGERITALAPWNAVQAAAAIVLVAPSIPLLFMGEEWGASAPFLFFSDFSGDLARAVTAGRRAEFAGDPQFDDPRSRERIPDPNALETFERSKLDWDERGQGPHAQMLAFYTSALRARREHVVPLLSSIPAVSVSLLGERALSVQWTFEGTTLSLIANLSGNAVKAAPLPAGAEIFAAGTSQDEAGAGTLAPWSVLWLAGVR